MRHVVALATFCTTLLLGATAPAAERIAVLDLVAGKKVDPGVTRGLSELLMAKVQGLGLGECIGSSDIKSLLSLEQSKQLLQCEDDASCVAEIGGALGVQRMLTGTVSRIGSQYLITLKLFDVKHARVLARAARQVPADEDQLLSALPDLVVELFKAVPPEPSTPGQGVAKGATGTLIVRSVPSHCAVTLAGRKVGETPLKLPKLGAGSYELQVTHRDYSTHQSQVTVVPAQDTIVEVNLELDPTLALRNYEFAHQKWESDHTSSLIWGICLSAAGTPCILGGLGTIVVMLLPGNNTTGTSLLGALLGAGITALGVGITGSGVMGLLSLPEEPEKPVTPDISIPTVPAPPSQPATQDGSADTSS
ncbi:MAG: PEGA domain-containing protein [Pseudomonadota bacterium]